MGAQTNENKPFATLADLESVCQNLDETQRKRAEKLLALVSAVLRRQCDWQEIEPDVLALVTCQVVARTIQTTTEAPIGVKSESWTASPFGGSVSYANPTGDIYLTTFERKLLGIGACEVIAVNQQTEHNHEA